MAKTIQAMVMQAALKRPEAKFHMQATTIDAPKMTKAQLDKSYAAASVMLAKALAMLEA